MESIGEKIFNLRKEKGVSQEELAFALNVARQTVSKWERDLAQPTTENIKALCEFFGVASAYFFDEKEIAVAKAEHCEPIEQTTVTEEVKKEPKFKTLKTVSVVVGMVILLLCIIICGIALYLTVDRDKEPYVDTVNVVNYESIIFLVVGIVVATIFITLTVIFINKYFKNKKKK